MPSKYRNERVASIKTMKLKRSSSIGRERTIVNQTNIGTVSQAALGKLLRDGMERIWAYPSAIDNHLELN